MRIVYSKKKKIKKNKINNISIKYILEKIENSNKKVQPDLEVGGKHEMQFNMQ